MATRFKLPGSGTPGLTPALRYAWTHVQASRVTRPMATSNQGTAFVSTSYVPDAADHTVAGASHVATFVSSALAAQAIPAQTVALSVLCNQSNASNALVVTWHLYVVDAADVLRGTLVNGRLDGTVCAATLNYRTDSATSTSVTTQDGDRLVLEIGLSGTPGVAGGTQGHNGVIRFGDNLGTDIPASDTGTADAVPWVELATTTLAFAAPPPATSGAARPRTGARLAAVGVKGLSQAAAPRASFAARAVGVKGLSQAVGPRASGRAAAVGRKGLSQPAAPRVRSRARIAPPNAARLAIRARLRAAARPAPRPPWAGAAAFADVPGRGLAPALPPGWAVDDVLLLLFTHTGSTGPLAPPLGWTQLATRDVGAAQHVELWWRRATAATAPPALALVANGVSTVRGARIYAVRGLRTDGSPVGTLAVQGNAASATVGVPSLATAGAQETVLALVAYAADPQAATTMPAWTQPTDGVAGFSDDPGSGSGAIPSDDIDTPSGGAAGPGAALIHEYRAMASAGDAATAPIAVSGGTFSPATSVSIAVSFAPVPTAALRARIRLRAVSGRGGPALGRTRALARTVAGKATARPAVAVASASAALRAAKVGLAALVPRAGARISSLFVKGGLAVGAVRARTASVVDSMRTPKLQAATAGRLRSRGRSEGAPSLSPGPLPVRPPTPIDLGEIYRGDTVLLPTWAAVARNGVPVDLTAASLRFTAKTDLVQADGEPTVINASTEDGSIAILDPPAAGRYRVRIDAAETQPLELDGAFTFDVQLQPSGSALGVYTIQYGRLLVVRDVTRTPA